MKDLRNIRTWICRDKHCVCWYGVEHNLQAQNLLIQSLQLCLTISLSIFFSSPSFPLQGKIIFNLNHILISALLLPAKIYNISELFVTFIWRLFVKMIQNAIIFMSKGHSNVKQCCKLSTQTRTNKFLQV